MNRKGIHGATVLLAKRLMEQFFSAEILSIWKNHVTKKLMVILLMTLGAQIFLLTKNGPE